MKTTKYKYTVTVISNKCKFYELTNEAGERLATIEYESWNCFEYRAVFACNSIKENKFHTLKEAKLYVEQILAENNL